MNKKLKNGLMAGLSVALVASATAVSAPPAGTGASSHREAPLIANDPTADTTDVYAFVSPDRPDSVTLIANWIPFESPDGGPNYFRFDENAVYRINIDNVGDAQAHIIYEVTFKNQLQNPNTFLYNTGPMNAKDDPDYNQRQYFTVTEIITQSGVMTKTVLWANAIVAPVNIGDKSTPGYPAISDSSIDAIGAGANEFKVFIGQADDPFWVDLTIFDLLTLRPQPHPIGYQTGTKKGLDSLAGYNVHSIAFQIPTSRLLGPSGDPVIGVWASTHRPSMMTVGALNSVSYTGTMVQVSRLGMPLVNEVVIPLALKDAFNSIPPSVDVPLATGGISGLEPAGALLLKSVLTPELQSLLNGLYGVPNPGKPRSDIFDIFLAGMELKQPFTITTAGGPAVLPAGFKVTRPMTLTQGGEMLRLNTSVKGNLCDPNPKRLGVLAGDACGFPNGRRLMDDVIDIELLAVAGAAWRPLTNDSSFSFDASLIGTLDDGVYGNDRLFRPTFPYLAYANQGQRRWHQNPIVVTNIPFAINAGSNSSNVR